MNMKTRLPLLLLASMAFMPIVHAQCATGVDTGGQCIPPEELPGAQQGNQTAQPQQPQVQWATRWGAIAIDNSTGSTGVSENQTSKSAASDEALQRCASKSNSQHCELKLAYYNQCAALAWGNGQIAHGHALAQTQAQSLALQACQESGGTNCKIVYTACALPVRIQ
jgi:hypothetical protein